MEIKFCAVPRCSEVAIKAGRSSDFCRAHYATGILATVADDLVTATVIGPVPITGADGKQVTAGGSVVLDPVEVNIPALVYAEHVKIAPAQAQATEKA
jgi:hypothetical protein